MPRFQILILFLFISILVHAGSLDRFSKPGLYKVIGHLDIIDKKMTLTVFAKSQSEIRLRLQMPTDKKVLLKLASLLHHKVTVTGNISQPPQNQRGEMSLVDVSSAVPDPIDPADGDGFWKL